MGSVPLVIAIDGPAGAGKSTAAANLARRLGLIHLNSGALFRAVGLTAHHSGVDLTDDAACAKIARSLHFEFTVDGGGRSQLLVNGRSIDVELRSPLASELSSRMGVLPSVRDVLLNVQREIAARSSFAADRSEGNPSKRSRGGVVVEGRDAGTVVFPDAPIKFYLDASPEVRAKRRATETGEDEDDVLRQALERDARDMSRAVAPLAASADAVRLDTSDLNAAEVIDKMVAILKERRLIQDPDPS